jgi:hypothetical protein
MPDASASIASVIPRMLDQLADLQAQRDALQVEKQRLIDSILTPEIRAKLAEIDLEFDEKTETVNQNITELEEAVKNVVKNSGSSYKGQYLQAVWSRPRITWDTPSLEHYAEVHPEILRFRKQGEPSVSIRALKKPGEEHA